MRWTDAKKGGGMINFLKNKGEEFLTKEEDKDIQGFEKEEICEVNCREEIEIRK